MFKFTIGRYDCFGVFWNSREARTHASKKAVIQLDIKAVALRTLRYSCQFGCRSKFWIKLVGASFKVCILPERKMVKYDRKLFRNKLEKGSSLF